MATFEGRFHKTYIAGSAVSQFRFVDLAADGEVDHSGDGAKAVGVTLMAADPSDADRPATAVTVAYGGKVLVEVGTDGLTAGDAVGSDSVGKAVTAASTNIILGYAREDASEGEFASVDFFLGGNAAA